MKESLIPHKPIIHFSNQPCHLSRVQLKYIISFSCDITNQCSSCILNNASLLYKLQLIYLVNKLSNTQNITFKSIHKVNILIVSLSIKSNRSFSLYLTCCEISNYDCIAIITIEFKKCIYISNHMIKTTTICNPIILFLFNLS